MKKIFNLDETYVYNQCKPDEAKEPKDTRYFPDQDFLEVLVEGTKKIDTKLFHEVFDNVSLGD